MFGKEDNTYHELRDKSITQWLDGISRHEDIEVRGGTELTKDYIDDLKKMITMLEQKNKLKDSYLRKLKAEKDQK
jgi:hypothetical protein